MAFNIPYEYLKRHQIVPLEEKSGCLQVAVTETFSEHALRAVAMRLEKEVIPIPGRREDILCKIEMNYGLGNSGLDSFLGDYESNLLGNECLEVSDDLSSEAPAIRLFNYILDRAVELRASDIHLEPERNNIRLRLRIDGVLHDLEPIGKKIQAAIAF